MSPAHPPVPPRMLTANGRGPAASRQQAVTGSGSSQAATGPDSREEKLPVGKEAGPETAETDNTARR